MRALIVTDEGSRGALAATRSLGRAGCLVGVASTAPRPLAGASRFARHSHQIPPPQDSGGMVSAVNALVQRFGYEVLLPAGDDWLLTLSARRQDVAAALPYGPHDVVTIALNKLTLTAAAERVGLAVPKTLPATHEAVSGWRGPAVVKAATHWLPGRTVRGRLEAVIAGDRQSLQRRVAEIADAGAQPILQEVVRGSLMALTVLRDGASGIAYVQQQADRTWPSQVGPSAAARTVPVDPVLADRVRRLLEELRWVGLAQLQFVLPTSGLPRLIDLNGRLYGSLQLAISAGVDLPTLWTRLAAGQRLPSTGIHARAGVRYCWVEGDVRRAVHERRGGALRECARVLGAVPAALRPPMAARDLMPAGSHAARLARRGLRKIAGSDE